MVTVQQTYYLQHWYFVGGLCEWHTSELDLGERAALQLAETSPQSSTCYLILQHSFYITNEIRAQFAGLATRLLCVPVGRSMRLEKYGVHTSQCTHSPVKKLEMYLRVGQSRCSQGLGINRAYVGGRVKGIELQ